MKKFITLLVLMFLFNINASAASLCSYQEQSELNSKAANVKVSYEIKEQVIEGEFTLVYNYIDITIFNISEDVYVEVTNDYNKDKSVYRYSNTQSGLVTFTWSNIDKVTNFTIKVYSSDNTGCPDEKFKTIYLTTPRYNDFSRRTTCADYPEFYLCQKFVTFPEINDARFTSQIDKYISGELDDKGNIQEEPIDENIFDTIFNFVKEYIWYILITVGVLTIGGYSIYRVKTKKQRELGL